MSRLQSAADRFLHGLGMSDGAPFRLRPERSSEGVEPELWKTVRPELIRRVLDSYRWAPMATALPRRSTANPELRVAYWPCELRFVIMFVMANSGGENLSDDLKRDAREAHRAFAAKIEPFLQEQFKSDGSGRQ